MAESPAGIRHILCAVDFSEPSEFALTYAALMAKKLGARLTAIHAFELMSHVFPDDSALDFEAFETAAKRGIDAQLGDLAARCSHGIDIERCLVEGVPYRAIIDEAAKLGADMIIVGTHGRTGLPHLLLGSVAQRIIRTSTIPVLTVRAPSAAG